MSRKAVGYFLIKFIMAQQTKAKVKPKKKRKVKKRIRITQKASIVRKDSIQRDSARNDTLPKAPARMYRDTGANFKIKIRRK